MKNLLRKYVIVLSGLLLFWAAATATEPNNTRADWPTAKAAVIVCKGMIDDGLYKSIRRRTQIALDEGAEYLIYEISTYGGLVSSADDISKYFILEVGKKAHTVAYITTEAISAGAMISVSCQDIIMLENTTIGDCAPVVLAPGTKLEGVEREKQESFIRAAFDRAAEANGYPRALLRAMVTMQIEVYRVKNIKTGEYEFFESIELSNKDPNEYDLDNKELKVENNKILTLTASEAFEYGIARAVVKERAGVLDFLAGRDGVTFPSEPVVLKTIWSEEMVRWLNSPAVMGILVMLALLGVYIEFNTPGIGLPGLTAAICFAIIIGSKYLVGLANWVEVALFIVGVILLMVEIFVLPGFGVAGFLGIICILAGLFGMLIRNPPGKLPWPTSDFDWSLLEHNLYGLLGGFIGFLIVVYFVARHLPRIPVVNRLVLAVPEESVKAQMTITEPAAKSFTEAPVQVGQKGISISQLRPAGQARFNNKRVDVVSRGELIETKREIIVAAIEGNRIVVKEISNPKNIT